MVACFAAVWLVFSCIRRDVSNLIVRPLESMLDSMSQLAAIPSYKPMQRDAHESDSFYGALNQLASNKKLEHAAKTVQVV